MALLCITPEVTGLAQVNALQMQVSCPLTQLPVDPSGFL